MRRSVGLLTLLLVLLGAFAAQAQAGQRIGGGFEYLRTVGDIKDSPQFDANALGLMGSYQYRTGLFTIEGDLELIPDYGGTEHSLFEPQAYVLAGNMIYGGLGIGAAYYDGDWLGNPFYALRVGVERPFMGFGLDFFALYRFQEAEVLENLGEVNLDSITFCALIRLPIGN